MRVLTASANVGLIINRCKFVLLGVLLLHIVQTTYESNSLEEAAENYGNFTDHSSILNRVKRVFGYGLADPKKEHRKDKVPTKVEKEGDVKLGNAAFSVDKMTGNIVRTHDRDGISSKEKEKDIPIHPGELKCEEPKLATDWSAHVDPIMPLRSDHFLIPVLPYGPNNQLRGFRETIILAIKLNRTVVMPPFYKHRSDPSPGEISFPWRKVDENMLRKFITVASAEMMATACGGKFDIALTAREESSDAAGKVKRIQQLETFSGMKAFDENTKFLMDEILEMEHVESAKNGMMFLPLEAEKLQQVYPTDEKCALWLFPYRNIDLTKLLIKRKRKNDKNFDPDNPERPSGQDDDAAIISNVMHYSPRPQFIRDAASAFVADVIGTWDMVAMHWRYDEKDFMVHCQKGAGNTDKCDQLADVDPQVVAKNLAIYSNSVRSYGRYDAKIVYIAAPPSELELILKLKATIVEKLNVKVFTFEDVDGYLKKKFEGCAPIMDYYHDFVSLVEMEICSNAGSFVRSDASSWSKNIHLERLVRKKTRHDKPNEILISDDWTPDYWHPINEHILESLAKNAEEEAKINAERAEAGYAARNLADLAKKELEARKNGKVAGRKIHDENEKLAHEK